MLSIIPMNLLFHGGRDRASCHQVASGHHGVAETKQKCHRGAPCEVFQRDGEAAWVLLGWLGSMGDTGLVLKPPIVEADGGERLDGGMGQRLLSSHHDDEV